MVAFLRPTRDYEFVIFVFGSGGFGFSEFIPWSANSCHLNTNPLVHSTLNRKRLTMNTTRIVAALALTFAAAGSAMAQEASYDYPQALSSQTTRAAVQAELRAARADGSLIVNEASVGGAARFLAQRSRPAVKAEAVLALRSGQSQALTAEPHDFTVDLTPTPAVVALARR